MIKKIFVFGNEDLEGDNLPIKILPELRKKFADIEFELKDPNEEWFVLSNKPTNGYLNEKDIGFGEEIVAIDTVIGIKSVMVFEDLKKFSKAPNLSMHDFDALANLRYLQKLGKIKKVKIIGIPAGIKESQAIKEIIIILERDFNIK